MKYPTRPDWRWVTAVKLAEVSPEQVSGHLRRVDKMTGALCRFKRDMDDSQTNDEAQVVLLPADKHPILGVAHSYYQQLPAIRTILEGYLMTGASDEEIAEDSAIDPEIVAAYHDAFFDVRSKLNKPAWISMAVFGGMLHKTFHPADTLGFSRRIGWIGGMDVFRHYLTCRHDPAVQTQMVQMVKSALLRSSLELSMSASSKPDQAAEFIRVALEDDSSAGKKGMAASSEVAEELESFIVEMGESTETALSVADPTNESNLKLPARERRSRDYETAKDTTCKTLN